MATSVLESQLTGFWGMGETEDFVKGTRRLDLYFGYVITLLMNALQVLVLLLKGETSSADLLNSFRATIPKNALIYGILDDGSLRPPLHPTQDMYFFFCKSLNVYSRVYIGDQLPPFFNSRYDTVILIHGWGNWSPLSYFWNVTVDALANPASDLGHYNIIYVQWKYPGRYPLYNSALDYVPDVAAEITKLIKYVVEKGKANFERVHVIGHSLGAHVAGVTGKKMKKVPINGVSNTTIRRITALDPAFPLAAIEPVDGRLSYKDADFVDVIHSNGKTGRDNIALAFYAPQGDADFYPNGGSLQPGCSYAVPNLPVYCHHNRAIEYFFESVRREESKFTSTRCEDFIQFKSGYCDNNKKVSMGIRTPSGVSGTFYLYTEAAYPFSQT